jgi:hypothetical protein
MSHRATGGELRDVGFPVSAKGTVRVTVGLVVTHDWTPFENRFNGYPNIGFRVTLSSK